MPLNHQISSLGFARAKKPAWITGGSVASPEDFLNASWTATNIGNRVSNQIPGPYADTYGDWVPDTATVGSHQLADTASFTLGTPAYCRFLFKGSPRGILAFLPSSRFTSSTSIRFDPDGTATIVSDPSAVISSVSSIPKGFGVFECLIIANPTSTGVGLFTLRLANGASSNYGAANDDATGVWLYASSVGTS